MILSLRVANFRGFSGENREFTLGRMAALERGCVTSVIGSSGSGKSSIVSTLELLQVIARGARSTDQFHGGDLLAVSSELKKPCEIVIKFEQQGTVFQYGLKLEGDEQQRCWLVESEWLLVGKSDGARLIPVFARTGRLVEIGGDEASHGSYELDTKVFVLATFATIDRMHPLFRAKSYLANLLIFGDKIGCVNDLVPAEKRPCYLAPRGENLGAWLTYQIASHAGFYREFAAVLSHHLPQFEKLVVANEPITGNHLALLFKARDRTEAGRVVPLSMLATSERMILLGAVMETACAVLVSVDCVCDDFDLIEETCPALAAEIGRRISGRRHLIALHKRNHNLYQTHGVRIDRENKDVRP